jgi:crossover junction endodeoxyribonuclease RuvC
MQEKGQRNSRRIIGIDPGVATTGWGIVDLIDGDLKVVDYGIIETSKENSHADRLCEIYDDLKSLLVKFNPEYAGVEQLLFYNNAKTASAVGEARGVVLLTLKQLGVNIIECTPLQMKQSITGYGQADKKQVQENIKRIFEMDEIPKPDDAADALGIAITTLGMIGN